MTSNQLSRSMHLQALRQLALCISLLICTVLASCSPKFDVAEWTEEVMLHDGRMITVWRRAVAKGGGFPEARGADIEFELKYEAMGVHWKGGPLLPLMGFDIVDGVPWLVTYLKDKEACRGMQKTDTSSAYYKWQSGQWILIPHSNAPLQIVRNNLWDYYWGREPKDDAKGFVTWTKKHSFGGVKNPPISVHDWMTSHNRYCSNI